MNSNHFNNPLPTVGNKYNQPRHSQHRFTGDRYPLLLSLTSLLLLIFSCSTSTDHPQTGTTISEPDTIQTSPTLKSPIDSNVFTLNSDTLTIDKPCAVFYQPDSLQMQKRMKQVGENDFRAGADDYIYYINTSAEYLEKKGLIVIDAKNRNFLKFLLSNGSVQVIKLDTLAELWGMYLFTPKKKAYAADIMMIEEEYRNYYR